MSSSGVATTNSTETSPIGCDNLGSRHHTIENDELHDENNNNNKNNCNNNVSNSNHYQFNNINSNNNINNNNNNDHHTLQYTNSAKQYYNQWHQQTKNEQNDSTDNSDGQLALDQLLASLAVENDIIDQHLAKLNGTTQNGNHQTELTDNGKPIFTYPINRDNNFNRLPANGILKNDNYQNTNREGIHSNLNDVIANLTEFTRTESMRQRSLTNGSFNGTHQNNHTHNYHINQNSHNNNNSNHVNSNYHSNSISHTSNNHRSYQEPCNNAIKRLTSESENSSSISPSLSERSNGVSWSDQVGSGDAA